MPVNKFDAVDEHLVKVLLEYGHTESFVCRALKISLPTWERWKKENAAFLEKVSNWKEKADERIEKALYERAVGYRAEIYEENLEGEIVPVSRFWAPDVPAIIFWLTNRKKGDWKNKQEVEHNVEVGVKTGKEELEGMVSSIVEAAL